MRRLLAVASWGLLGSVLAAAAAIPSKSAGPAPAGAPPAPQPGPGRLVVHEWGTFTGFAGSDGAHLPFWTNVGYDLPDFVSNRLREAQRKGRPDAAGLLFIKAGGAAALQRMETPVVYFYTDRPRELDVRVEFPQGLLTEFYPPVRDMGPRYGRGLGEPSLSDPATRPAGSAFDDPSFLDWGRVRVTPGPAGPAATPLPEVKNGNPYAHARETDSARVEFTDDAGARHAEKFLFYRGLGNFALPVRLLAQGGDRFVLNNAGPAPVHSAFLVQVDGRPGSPTRFARYENIESTQETALPPAGAAAGNLDEEIVRALTAEGLYEKEARAMLATWRANWLGEPGTRLLYIVPRAVTDALLPLKISPAPDDTVRVLVGRIDVLTPEQESRLGSMMSAVAASGSDALSEEDVRALRAMGRFLSPALDRVAAEQARHLQRALGERTTEAK